ncbi:hypothetical protein [Streptomyces platensis]|uniref:hypothetical protein n=1 Tax=Streptomyces platensis TaxID=58346 RepID=UPI00386E4EB6|nr:hypothetical protein OG962_30740 [Streptomyces platensis]
MLKLAKDSAVKARTQAINQLKAVLVMADPNLREDLTGLDNPVLIRTCARLGSDCEEGGVGDGVAQPPASPWASWLSASSSSPHRPWNCNSAWPGSSNATPRSC